MKKKFLLIDGSSLLYRAFFALPLLNNAGGEYTNAVLGFANMFGKLWQQVKPDGVAIAFDKGKETFRHKIFTEYKGTRQKTPTELSAQIPILHEFARAMGIELLETAEYEADDIIGTLAKDAAKKGYEVGIVTGDRDALQLIDENIRVLFNKKGISDVIVYDEETFVGEYQFPPAKLIDLKGLMGDSSDNIPGIAGVGPKTASKLLLAYGSLEAVLAHADEVKGEKLRNSLKEQGEQAILSKRLATIEQNIPGLSFAADRFAWVAPKGSALKKFCQRYDLKRVWQNYQKIWNLSEDDGEPNLFADLKKLEITYRRATLAADFAAFDSCGQVALSADIRGKVPRLEISDFALAAEGTAPLIFNRADNLRTKAEAILGRAERVYVYGAKQLSELGCALKENFFDLKLVAYLLRPEMRDYELNSLIAVFCPDTAGEENFASTEEKLAWSSQAMLKLGAVLEAKLSEEKLNGVYSSIEFPLAAVLGEMEKAGISVNRDKLAVEAKNAAVKVAEAEADIYALAKDALGLEVDRDALAAQIKAAALKTVGADTQLYKEVQKVFKVNSPKQLGELLFERLKLPTIKKTKTGYSTDAEVLEELRKVSDHPIIERILCYRTWSKLKSTYLDGLAALIDQDSGRLYTNLHQTVTATGRLSSSDPNLQNIPVRTEEGRAIRALFEPGEGYDYLLSADYSQIELRILAHMSGDENLIAAFVDGEDIHARTAAEVFEVPLADVTSELRGRAKAVNFGIVYGISDYGLSKDLGISRHEAADYIRRYFAKYPKIKSFLDKLVADAHKNGYVTTMFGRKRELPGLKSTNYNQRMLAERMAMNTPIQGTAADIIKLAMLRAAEKLSAAKLKSRMLLQVHDELLLEVTEDEIETATRLVREAMEGAAKLSVPLSVDVNLGKNWAEAK